VSSVVLQKQTDDSRLATPACSIVPKSSRSFAFFAFKDLVPSESSLFRQQQKQRMDWKARTDPAIFPPVTTH
jgi:hypothetical protein